MKTIDLANGAIRASAIALGCWRICEITPKDAAGLIRAAMDAGINFFDNADCYGGGRSEEIFAEAYRASATREDIYIQTKCGIGNGYYDFSREHILEAAEGSLKRLKTDYIDVLLLHRPDALAEPEEIAEAFDKLHRGGKVRYFGVSNHNPGQIELLLKYVKRKLIINQLQFSVMHTGMIDAGVNVNMRSESAADHDGGVLDYCRLNGITVQAWSPLQYRNIDGVFVGDGKFPVLNECLGRIAQEKGVSASAAAVAWILRHPAKMQPIVGTTRAARLRDLAKAAEINLSRQEWYDIYKAAGNTLP